MQAKSSQPPNLLINFDDLSTPTFRSLSTSTAMPAEKAAAEAVEALAATLASVSVIPSLAHTGGCRDGLEKRNVPYSFSEESRTPTLLDDNRGLSLVKDITVLSPSSSDARPQHTSDSRGDNSGDPFASSSNGIVPGDRRDSWGVNGSSSDRAASKSFHNTSESRKGFLGKAQSPPGHESWSQKTQGHRQDESYNHWQENRDDRCHKREESRRRSLDHGEPVLYWNELIRGQRREQRRGQGWEMLSKDIISGKNILEAAQILFDMPELRQHFNRPLESPASQLPTRNNSNSNDKNIINSQKQHFANDAYKVIDPKHQQSKDYSVSASDRTTTYLAILINRLIARNQFSQAIRASRFVDGRDKDLHKEIVKQCLDAHKLQAIHDYVDGNLSTMRSILFIIEARLISQLRLWEIHLRVDEPKQSQSRAKVKWSNGPKLSVMQGLEHAPHSLKLVEIAMSLVVRFGEENYLQKVPHIDLFYRYSTIVILLKGSGESSWQIPAASKPLSSSTPPKPNSSPRPIPMEEYDLPPSWHTYPTILSLTQTFPFLKYMTIWHCLSERQNIEEAKFFAGKFELSQYLNRLTPSLQGSRRAYHIK